MGSDEFHKYDAGLEPDSDDQTEPIAANIEYNTPIADPIGASGIRLDIRKALPLRTPAFSSPLSKRRPRSRVQRPEIAKVFDFYYAHATEILQHSPVRVNSELNKMISHPTLCVAVNGGMVVDEPGMIVPPNR